MDPMQLGGIANFMSELSSQVIYGGLQPSNDMNMMFNQMIPQHPNSHKLEDFDDPEVDNIDDIINNHDHFDIMEDDFMHNKSQRKGKTNLGQITKKELEEMSDDDAIIDLFLKNPDRFTECEFYRRGHCKFGLGCKYYHPTEKKNDKTSSGFDRHKLDEECCICLEKVLAAGR
jgi:hypothetical protein